MPSLFVRSFWGIKYKWTFIRCIFSVFIIVNLVLHNILNMHKMSVSFESPPIIDFWFDSIVRYFLLFRLSFFIFVSSERERWKWRRANVWMSTYIIFNFYKYLFFFTHSLTHSHSLAQSFEKTHFQSSFKIKNHK